MQFERTRMYQVRDVADHFGVSVATIYRAIEAGQLTALRMGTGAGALRVPGEAIKAYAAACARAARESATLVESAPADIAADGAR